MFSSGKSWNTAYLQTLTTWFGLSFFYSLLVVVASFIQAQSNHNPTASLEKFTVDEWPGRPFEVYYHLPKKVDADTIMLLVFPDHTRQSARYSIEWEQASRDYNLITLVPVYTHQQFPAPFEYEFGGLFNHNFQRESNESSLFASIEVLWQKATLLFNLTSAPKYLYGHGDGARLAHRYLLLNPKANIAKIVMANPDWHTKYDWQYPFPVGLRNSGVSLTDVKSSLSVSTLILLSALDNKASAPRAQNFLSLESLGGSRLSRGFAFHQSLLKSCDQLRLTNCARLEIVPDIYYGNKPLVPHAARFLSGFIDY